MTRKKDEPNAPEAVPDEDASVPPESRDPGERSDGSIEPVEGEDAAETEDLARTHLEALQRTMADFDNYRKRMDRERENWKRDARIEVVAELLDTVDNLERALENMDGPHRDGISGIYEGLRRTLERFGLEELDPEGEHFDPNLHEAMMTEENDEVEEDTVLEVLSKGYVMEGRLVRPAKVKVSK